MTASLLVLAAVWLGCGGAALLRATPLPPEPSRRLHGVEAGRARRCSAAPWRSVTLRQPIALAGRDVRRIWPATLTTSTGGWR